MLLYPFVVRNDEIYSSLNPLGWPIEAKFHVEPQWVVETKVCSRNLGHMTKMAASSIYGKIPSFKIILWNQWVGFHETWYVALGTWSIILYSNDDPGLTLPNSMQGQIL